MTLGIEREGLAEPLRELVGAGTPVLGTCAGLIMLDREHLGLLDVTARRNAFGRQVHSFEADLELKGLDGGPVRAVFIRAPWVEDAGDGVEVLAEWMGTRLPSARTRYLRLRSIPRSMATLDCIDG